MNGMNLARVAESETGILDFFSAIKTDPDSSVRFYVDATVGNDSTGCYLFSKSPAHQLKSTEIFGDKTAFLCEDIDLEEYFTDRDGDLGSLVKEKFFNYLGAYGELITRLITSLKSLLKTLFSQLIQKLRFPKAIT